MTQPTEGRPARLTEVVLTTGRFALRVGSVYVACEGDPCRDPNLAENIWDRRMLENAAEKINSAALVAASSGEPPQDLREQIERGFNLGYEHGHQVALDAIRERTGMGTHVPEGHHVGEAGDSRTQKSRQTSRVD